MNVLSLDGVGAFILLVLPGAISLQVYRMILPGRPTPWSESIYQAVFYSLLNFAVLFPICLFLLDFACCSSRIVGRGFDLRKEFTSVNSSSGPELTRKRLVRELRRSFVFEKNHPAKDEDFSRTLNIC